MTFVAAKCPQCGGALQVPDDRDMVKCMYCAFDIRVREAVRLIGGDTKNLLELAKHAADAGNSEEAYNYYTKVLEIDPKNYEAWFGKGNAAGWLSKLNDFRFSEMRVAFDNAITNAPEKEAALLRIECAASMATVGTACYRLAHEHMMQFIALDGTWAEYLPRCRQIISLQEVEFPRFPGHFA